MTNRSFENFNWQQLLEKNVFELISKLSQKELKKALQHLKKSKKVINLKVESRRSEKYISIINPIMDIHDEITSFIVAAIDMQSIKMIVL